MLKNILLVLFSGLLGVVLWGAGYEFVMQRGYEQWKVEYRGDGDWANGLIAPSDNPVLLWQYRPNAAVEHWGSEIATNPNGFRDSGHGPAVVAFFGDSVTVGIGVTEEENFVSRYHGLSGKEARNVAVDGYSGVQVMELVRLWAEAASPRRVVYVMCLNDFSLGKLSTGRHRYFKRPDSFFLLAVERRWTRFFDHHLYFFDKNKGEVFREIAKTADRLNGQGIEFTVVVVPVFQEHGFENYTLRRMHAEISARMEAARIPVLDLLEDFEREADGPTSHALDIWHLNERGHELVADRVKAHLN